jgi:type IV pilus assembly protein PilA
VIGGAGVNDAGDIHSRNLPEARFRVSNMNPLLGRGLAPGFMLRTLRTFLPVVKTFPYTGRYISQNMRKHGNRAGFTLVEVIVVIVIIAILAAIGVPALTGYIEKAHEKELIAVANTSVKALQAWATEQYAYGNVGDEGLRDPDGNPVSLASYTGESGRFNSNDGAGGSIVTADYHPASGQGVMNETASDEGIFLPAAVEPEWHDYFTVDLSYHFIDKNGTEQIDTIHYDTGSWIMHDYELTYAKVACGMPVIEFIDENDRKDYITPPPLPEGYRATKATQQLIDSSVDLDVVTYYEDSIWWEGAYSGHLYYEEFVPDPSHWVRVVDRLAATDYESEGYVVTEVEFSDQNLLTHMKLTGPGGDFVVYANETYHYNADPTDGSSV